MLPFFNDIRYSCSTFICLTWFDHHHEKTLTLACVRQALKNWISPKHKSCVLFYHSTLSILLLCMPLPTAVKCLCRQMPTKKYDDSTSAPWNGIQSISNNESMKWMTLNLQSSHPCMYASIKHRFLYFYFAYQPTSLFSSLIALLLLINGFTKYVISFLSRMPCKLSTSLWSLLQS